MVAYIQKIRVEAAKKFLEQETSTVGEIMYEVGYNDPEAVRKIFKRATDLSPMQYRTKYQERKATPSPSEYLEFPTCPIMALNVGSTRKVVTFCGRKAIYA